MVTKPLLFLTTTHTTQLKAFVDDKTIVANMMISSLYSVLEKGGNPLCKDFTPDPECLRNHLSRGH